MEKLFDPFRRDNISESWCNWADNVTAISGALSLYLLAFWMDAGGSMLIPILIVSRYLFHCILGRLMPPEVVPPPSFPCKWDLKYQQGSGRTCESSYQPYKRPQSL
ncbi:hypothetical protein NHH03_24750 [Stieleria sp. TO1_6]|uniref:hypothetical protein n=1 Tax=Stieleria tagensis TaxID=2956795 RepID=UPI00209AE199|nr:hypothetical protein [Stieleria tagensis]MCO8124969.1 hypothetical protein [Stieleria tagensis]